jgi:hypothetical protein
MGVAGRQENVRRKHRDPQSRLHHPDGGGDEGDFVCREAVRAGGVERAVDEVPEAAVAVESDERLSRQVPPSQFSFSRERMTLRGRENQGVPGERLGLEGFVEPMEGLAHQ